MIKSLVVIVLLGVLSLRFTDTSSDSTFYSAFLPFMVFVSLLSLAIWFVLYFQKTGRSQTTKSRGDGFFSGFGDGGGE